MSVGLTVSLISAVVALGSAVLTAVLGARAAKGRLQLQAEIDEQHEARRNQEERLSLMNRVRDPVLQKLKGQHSYLYLFTGAGVQRQGRSGRGTPR
jgi:hypothetical protein